jgi:RecB family endonuclease NucS
MSLRLSIFWRWRVPSFEMTQNAIQPLTEVTFSAAGMRERYDLQRLLRANISAIDADLYVLAEEYGAWEDARRNIDLLCLDKSANLVVIELKRTEDGGHMELQALQYAAMVSKMTFEYAVEAHKTYLARLGEDRELPVRS